jgi:hypothetical protein
MAAGHVTPLRQLAGELTAEIAMLTAGDRRPAGPGMARLRIDPGFCHSALTIGDGLACEPSWGLRGILERTLNQELLAISRAACPPDAAITHLEAEHLTLVAEAHRVARPW